MKITIKSVKAAVYRGGTDYRFDDGVPGFGFRVYPSGKKSFLVTYRSHGRKRFHTLGQFGILTVDEARKLAKSVLVSVTNGADPAETKLQGKSAPTVEALKSKFMLEYSAIRRKERTQYEDDGLWRRYVLPALGQRLVKDVRRDDIARLHSSMSRTRTAANRTVSLLHKAFELAELWGWRPEGTNPCKRVERYKEKGRERFLSLEEFRRLGETLDAAAASGKESRYAIAAIRLLIFTGARMGEVLKLRWTEVDLENGWLNLPDSKTGAKRIALSLSARKLLSELPRMQDNDWVIVGRKPGAPLTDLERPWRRLRRLALLDDVRLHDLRHSYASLGASLGMSLPVIGRLLGHNQASTTQRYAHLAEDQLKKSNEEIGDLLAKAFGVVLQESPNSIPN